MKGQQQQQPPPQKQPSSNRPPIRPSDVRRHGFGSPPGMEMTNVVPSSSLEQDDPGSVPTVTGTGVPAQAQTPTADTTGGHGETPPSAAAAPVPATALEGQGGEDDTTPSKPRKRRLFFTPSPGKQRQSPTQQATSPLFPPTSRREPEPTPPQSGPPVATSTTLSTPTSTTTPPTARGSTGLQQQQRRRPRPTPMTTPGRTRTNTSSLSGLATATPRSQRRSAARNRATGGGGGFNPLGRISDIFSPQSPPSFSGVSPVMKMPGSASAAVAAGVADSGGDAASVGSNRSDEYSSASSDSSASRSVKEPFTEQVERLDELLATPSQQLGDLAFTNLETSQDNDDSLDTELSNLDASRLLLAQELSQIDFSLFGPSGPGGEGEGISPQTPSPTKGSQQAAASSSGKKSKRISGKDDDWVPLLAAEADEEPHFSPADTGGADVGSSSPIQTTKNLDSGQKASSKPRGWGKFYAQFRTPPRDKASKSMMSAASSSDTPPSFVAVSPFGSSTAAAATSTAAVTPSPSRIVLPSPTRDKDDKNEEDSKPAAKKPPPPLPPPPTAREILPQASDGSTTLQPRTPERAGPLPVSSPQSPFNPFHPGTDSETSTPARQTDISFESLESYTQGGNGASSSAGVQSDPGVGDPNSAAAPGNLFQAFASFAARGADPPTQPTIHEAQHSMRLLSELDAILTPPTHQPRIEEDQHLPIVTPDGRIPAASIAVGEQCSTPLLQHPGHLPSLVDIPSAQQFTPQQIPALADETTPQSQLSTSILSSTSSTGPTPSETIVGPGLLSQEGKQQSDSSSSSSGERASHSMLSWQSVMSPRQNEQEHVHVAGESGGTPSRAFSSTRAEAPAAAIGGAASVGVVAASALPALAQVQSPTTSQGLSLPSHEPEVVNRPSAIVPILPDDADDEFIFDADSPQSQASPKSLPPLDSSTIPTSYDTAETPGTAPIKSYSADSNEEKKDADERRKQRRICIACVVILFLAGLSVTVWAIVNATRRNEVPENPPSLQPTITIAPSPSVPVQPSTPPTFVTVSPTPISSGAPTILLPSTTPSTAPTPLSSLAPTPFGAISFKAPYEIFIPNGLVDVVPQSEYIPALIESMDLLTFDILLNVDENGQFNGDGMSGFAAAFAFREASEDSGGERQRKLVTAVLLPTQVTDVVDVECPQATTTDLCQRIDALITLEDAEDTWREFQFTTELAIEIGRLQFHLIRVDPNSPAEVMDSLWSPPAPTTIPLVPTVFPTAQPSTIPSDMPSIWPSNAVTTFESNAPTILPGSSPSIQPSFPAKTLSPSIQGSVVPTVTTSKLPSLSPSSSPTSFDLLDFLVRQSFDGGSSLNDPSSPQSRAYSWLQWDEFLDEYPPWRVLQRYAMATLYFATNGGTWLINVSWLTNLPECEWYSKAGSRGSCNANNMLVNLELDLNDLEGVLPPELGLLSSSLERITLRGGPTKYLSGTIPSEMGFLTKLRVFFVRGNRMSGVVPSQIGQWSQLEELDLSRNQFVGTLPTQMGTFQALTFFEVSANLFSGFLPTELGRLVNCTQLLFEDNTLLTPIPTQFGSLGRLQVLRGGMNVILRMPSELGRLSSVELITLQGSSIPGTIPSEFGQLTRLRLLDLGNNNLSGNIPSEVGNLVALRDELDLSFNRLTGMIPSQLGAVSDLRGLALNNNLLTGQVPASISQLDELTSIRLESNSLSGTVPAEVCLVFNSTYPAFWADCADFDDNCPCCTTCCDAEGGDCVCRYLGTPQEFLCYQQKKQMGP